MRKLVGYHILAIGLTIGIGLAIGAGTASAQQLPEADIYCSALVTDQVPPQDTYLISGEESNYKNTFIPGDVIYINRGADQGVKVGDQFEVIRAESDRVRGSWFKYQPQLKKAMGTTYVDVGRLVVTHVQPKTSSAEIKLACDLMQRGDILRPFENRPSPALRPVKFDPLAPPSGKQTAMIVTTKNFGSVSGPGRIVFVNLGSAQGVHVGDYFRVFHYQGTRAEAVYQESDTAYKVYGFGSTPVAYRWNDLPREVTGQGIVLRIGPNSSTVLLTDTRQEVSVGDYVELE